jgi:hypothetical protein
MKTPAMSIGEKIGSFLWIDVLGFRGLLSHGIAARATAGSIAQIVSPRAKSGT